MGFFKCCCSCLHQVYLPNPCQNGSAFGSGGIGAFYKLLYYTSGGVQYPPINGSTVKIGPGDSVTVGGALSWVAYADPVTTVYPDVKCDGKPITPNVPVIQSYASTLRFSVPIGLGQVGGGVTAHFSGTVTGAVLVGTGGASVSYPYSGSYQTNSGGSEYDLIVPILVPNIPPDPITFGTAVVSFAFDNSTTVAGPYHYKFCVGICGGPNQPYNGGGSYRAIERNDGTNDPSVGNCPVPIPGGLRYPDDPPYGDDTPTDPNTPVQAQGWTIEQSPHVEAQAPIVSSGPIRVGVVMPCAHMGGGENWTLNLLKTTASTLSWQGVCSTGTAANANAYMVNALGAYCPVTYCVSKYDLSAISDLAKKCDVIISWIVEDHSKYITSVNPSCRVIWADHFVHDDVYPNLAQFCLQAVSAIVGVSELCTPGVPQQWLSKYRIIYNGIDTDKLVVKRSRAVMRSNWGVPLAAKVAGLYARMALVRRPDAMVRLIASLPSEWHVVLVGEPVETDEMTFINQQIAALPAATQARIHVMGADAATGDVMAAIDVLVDPSATDSFGLTKVEAMAAGIPVVATPTGVAKLHPEYCYSIPIDDGIGTTTAPNITAAVLSAYKGGAKSGAKTFATVACAPGTFGAAWISLVSAVAGKLVTVPGVVSLAETNLSMSAIPRSGCGCGSTPALESPERQARRDAVEESIKRRKRKKDKE